MFAPVHRATLAALRLYACGTLAVILNQLPSEAHAQVALQVTVDQGGPVRVPSDPVVVRINRAVLPTEGGLAFVIGLTDLTALFRQVAPAEFVYDARQLPLSPGENRIVVYLVRGRQWGELAQLSVDVRDPEVTAAPAQRSQFQPRLDLSVKGQPSERRHGNTPPADFRRSSYQDTTLQGGFALQQTVGDFDVGAEASVGGSSYRKEAVRFSDEGAGANKVDLNSYRAEVSHGASRLSGGHIQYGNHPLLLNSYGSRGLTFSQRIGEQVDFSLNAMNGTSIVGAENFFGLDEAAHRIHGLTAGVELLPARRGGLRAELTALDASLQSKSNFNQGMVPDAETSQGSGLRLMGATEDGRVRGDAAFARSRYVNPQDPALSQGFTLVEVKPETRDARLLIVSYEPIRDARLFSDRLPVSVVLGFQHNQIDPLYKSLGAPFGSDLLQNRWSGAMRVGPIETQVYALEREDNLDSIPTILKTRTRESGIALTLPLAPLLVVAPEQASIWPALQFVVTRNHQFAVNEPAFAESGFQASHRPDQFNRNARMAANWNGNGWNFTYSLDRSTQDNRQLGREQADFANVRHGLALGWQVMPTLSTNFATGRSENESEEQSLTTEQSDYSVGFAWQATERLSLSGNYGPNRQRDSKNLAVADSFMSQTQLGYRFDVAGYGRNLPGQFFLRHASQSAQSTDNTFGFSNSARMWSITAGVTISLF